MIKEFKPEVIICNSDAFDGQVLSRFPSINFDQKPTVLEELNACRYHLDEIEKVRPAGCRLIWTLGNHDMRYESWLVNKVPEYSGVDGFSLKYHFPNWETCWSFWIGEETVVKHRVKGGRTAGYSNLLAAGNTNIVTGHTHVLCASPITNYQGTYWGVQTGCLGHGHRRCPRRPLRAPTPARRRESREPGGADVRSPRGCRAWPASQHSTEVCFTRSLPRTHRWP